ncbi:MAG TPA: AI-2E family transporter [Acidimicrobiia bacterium]|nr:AI-2E family transporter [Acidimicrobiia bacterium]
MTKASDRQNNQLFRRRTFIVVGVLVASAAAVYLVFRIRNLVFIIFVAVFMAVAMEPPVHYLAKRGWRRGPATALVFVVAFALMVGFFVSLAPLLVDQINALIDALPGYIGSVAQLAQDWFGIELSTETLQQEAAGLPDIVANAGGTVLGGLLNVTEGVAGFLFFATTVALFSFYIVAELPQLQRTILSTMPPERQRDALHVWDVAVEKMGGYIYSRLILALVSATLSSIFLSVLGVPYAVPLGIWVGVLSQLIPVIGTYLAAILPAVVALSAEGVGTMVWVLVGFVGYQQVENFLIAPRITKRTMEIHPAVSIGAIIIGSTLLGPIGVILALPMTGVIQALISETRRRHHVITDALKVPADG